MKEIFTDLYKKVLGFFQTQEKEENAKDVAVNRMKLVLMQDRTNLTPFLLEKMRGEMIAVLAKYVEMDQEALELNFEQEGEQMALMLSIPVLRAKEEEEIQAILDKEAAEKAEAEAKAAEESEESSDEDSGEEEIDSEEEVEETDEDVEEDTEEDVCSTESEDQDSQEISESPDVIEEVEETPSSSKKSKKK